MINPNLARWIKASINIWFKAQLNPVFLQFEETKRESGQLTEFFEIFMSGPFSRELPSNHQIHDFDIGLIASCVKGNKIYDLDVLIGKAQQAESQSIPIKKFGTTLGTDDPTVLIGCAELRTDVRRPIDVLRYGETKPGSNVVQASIEAHYRLEIY